MKRSLTLCADLSLVALTSLLALLLRDNLFWVHGHFSALVPYLVFSAVSALLLFLLTGLDRAIWRYTSFSDITAILIVSLGSVIGGVVAAFAFHRMEGLARSVPLLHFALLVLTLSALRFTARLRHLARRPAEVPSFHKGVLSAENVLILGTNDIADFFVRLVGHYKTREVHIVGFVGRSPRHRGRTLHGAEVLGLPEDIQFIVQNLEGHGIQLGRIILTVRRDELSDRARQALYHLESTSTITIDDFGERMGFYKNATSSQSSSPQNVQSSPVAPFPPASHISAAHAPLWLNLGQGRSSSLEDEITAFIGRTPILPTLQDLMISGTLQRPYWRMKRLCDCCVALCLLVLFSPLLVLLSFGVLYDLGWPVLFWQQRPGAFGRTFRLYKFRTMGPAHDYYGLPVQDEHRISKFGTFLRRSRLDELPQLFSVLKGDMSFVGPRPLILVEQSDDVVGRLAIRPGITGWAQVHAGRDVAVSDKAALDVWYLKNASFFLDLRILLKTVRFLFQSPSPDFKVIQDAWSSFTTVKAQHDIQKPFLNTQSKVKRTKSVSFRAPDRRREREPKRSSLNIL